MALFPEFPYTNFHELNNAWMLKELKHIITTMEQFVSLNSLKYADPIQWDITTQYEKNTIVIEPNSGTAYISVQAVPSSVDISNTDYWTPVFDLSVFITRAGQNFADTFEANTTTTATQATPEGGWVVWDSILYEALTNISIGDAYVPGGNIEQRTVEYFFNLLKNSIAQEVQDRQDEDTRIELELRDLITSEVNTRASEDARIELQLTDLINSRVSAVQADLGNITDLNTTDKSSAVAAINEVLSLISSAGSFTTPEKYGAVGDGVTDDTAAIQDAINSGARGVVFANKYLITDTLRMAENQMLIGCYALICTYDDIVMIDATNRSHWTMEGIQLLKYEDNNSLHMNISGANWTIRNCKFSNDVPGDFSNWIGGIEVKASDDGNHDNFCGRIENCHFVRSNIVINNHTDGFLINNIIWANSGTYSPARYAAEVNSSSWLISGNQFVGGTSGGLRVEGTQEQIVDNFFDGSHAVLNTGRGLICNSCGQGLIIQGNKFYNQYKNAIALLNCQQALINGNTFRLNNRSHLAYNEIETNEQVYGNRHIITNNTFVYEDDSDYPYNIVNQYSADIITLKNNYITGYQNTADAYCFVNYKTIISEGNIINGRLYARFSGSVHKCNANYGIAVPMIMNTASLHKVYINGVDTALYSLISSNGVAEIVKGDNGNLDKAITVIISYYQS